MPDLPGLHSCSIHRFHDGRPASTTDFVTVEEPLDVRLSNGGPARSVAITMRTPGRDEHSASSVEPGSQVQCKVVKSNVVAVDLPPHETIDWKRLDRHSYTSSSCGVCGKTSLDSLRVPAEVLQGLPDKLRAAQELFERTGGIHAVGLFTPAGELLHVAEDVGRHNALDKLIGHHHATGALPLDEHILLLSGRASFELVQKAGMAGITVVAAVGAPSSLAVQLAEELGITLVGFLRAGGFNCYAGVERIG